MFVPAVGSTQTPIWWLLGALYLEVNWLRHEADYPPPSNSKVKNEWSCTSILPYVITSCIKTADLYFSYLYFSMFAPHFFILMMKAACSTEVLVYSFDALDDRLFRTLEIINLMICFMSCTSFCVINYFSEN